MAPPGSESRNILPKLFRYADERGVKIKDMVIGDALKKASEETGISEYHIKKALQGYLLGTESIDSYYSNNDGAEDGDSLHEKIPSGALTPDEILEKAENPNEEQDSRSEIEQRFKSFLPLLEDDERDVIFFRYILPSRRHEGLDVDVTEYGAVTKQINDVRRKKYTEQEIMELEKRAMEKLKAMARGDFSLVEKRWKKLKKRGKY